MHNLTTLACKFPLRKRKSAEPSEIHCIDSIVNTWSGWRPTSFVQSRIRCHKADIGHGRLGVATVACPRPPNLKVLNSAELPGSSGRQVPVIRRRDQDRPYTPINLPAVSRRSACRDGMCLLARGEPVNITCVRANGSERCARQRYRTREHGERAASRTQTRWLSRCIRRAGI